MKYCDTCKVNVRGARTHCPLCGNPLRLSDPLADTENSFPEIPPHFERRLAVRIMVFISLSAIIISFAVRMIFPSGINWPIFVLFGIGSAWLSLAGIIRKGHSLPKVIIWQTIVIPVLALFWDWLIGWHGWSLDYLIPILYVAAEIVMYVTAQITRLRVRDFIIYAFLAGLFGVLPALFILLHWVKTPFPSILCVAVSCIFLLAIFIFHGENINKELKRKMHI